VSPARPRTIYALLGKPVAENSTEEMIEAAFSAASVDTEYLSLTVEPEALAEAVAGVRALRSGSAASTSRSRTRSRSCSS
jgi:shikimate 5-dehydrogenase